MIGSNKFQLVIGVGIYLMWLSRITIVPKTWLSVGKISLAWKDVSQVLSLLKRIRRKFMRKIQKRKYHA